MNCQIISTPVPKVYGPVLLSLACQIYLSAVVFIINCTVLLVVCTGSPPCWKSSVGCLTIKTMDLVTSYDILSTMRPIV